MVDIVTTGWSGLQTLREADLPLILHGHRAGHAAFTRDKAHGISMLTIAKLSRLAGLDQLHIGTAVGKMEGPASEVTAIGEEIEHRLIRHDEHRHVLAEKWYDVKPIFAVCSGGLHPGHVPELVAMLGNDIIIQAGGGVHGHPDGTKAGAMAMRQAVDAVMEGFSLAEYGRKHKELGKAIKEWV
jgi:ribulose-bisphosphate carboxylase large chain